MKRIFKNKQAQVYRGDCLEVMKSLIEKGVQLDSITTDPPYHLVAMTKRFGSKTAKKVKSKGVFERASKGFMGECYHPDTQVLTWRGWRKIATVQLGDRVASLNPKTRQITYQEVIKHHNYAYDGDLLHIKHRSAEQLITPNHKIVLSKDSGKTLDLLPAEKIKGQFHLFAQGNWQAKERVFYIEGKKYNCLDFAYFLGLFLGDGYSVTRKNDHKSNDFFGFNVKKSRKIKSIRNALAALNIKYTETKRDYTSFYCYDFPILRYLKKLGKAKNKIIPTEWFLQPAEVLQALYKGLLDTDGHIQGKNQELIFTSSKSLANSIQRLCLHIGKSAIITTKPAKITTIMGKETVVSKAYTLSVLQSDKKLWIDSKESIAKIPYKGRVYCVTLPVNHIVYTRFNGKPVWSGNSWDGGNISFRKSTWALAYKLLKPGGHLIAFSGTRTYHKMATAIEKAGFEIRDCIRFDHDSQEEAIDFIRSLDEEQRSQFHKLMERNVGQLGWTYGSGFPHSHNIAKHVDKMYRGKPHGGADPNSKNHGKYKGPGNGPGIWEKNAKGQILETGLEDLHPEAQKWIGWGTALNPAWEPIVVARKPLSERTVALNMIKHKVGAINIDATRIERKGRPLRVFRDNGVKGNVYSGRRDGSLAGGSKAVGTTDLGGWPSNLVHDGSEEVLAAYASFGNRPSSGVQGPTKNKSGKSSIPQFAGMQKNRGTRGYEDKGTASRFFYSAKAAKSEKMNTTHPTVKPVKLMLWLIRMFTPEGGRTMDIFAGSGSTVEAALQGGFRVIGIEKSKKYAGDILKRIERHYSKPENKLNKLFS